MPKQRPGTRRVTIIVRAGDEARGIEEGAEAARLHMEQVPKDDLTAKAWSKAATGEGLMMSTPVVASRWTREGNLTVEVP